MAKKTPDFLRFCLRACLKVTKHEEWQKCYVVSGSAVVVSLKFNLILHALGLLIVIGFVEMERQTQCAVFSIQLNYPLKDPAGA